MRRGKLEIYLDVLDGIGHHEKMTHVMYYTNLNWRVLIKYVAHLMAKGLIQKRGKHHYLTEEGRIALQHGIDFKWAVYP
jgi:predicted transcriptional regulator